MGPATKSQIDSSFKWALTRDYDLLMLGSSKFYRGLNPDSFKIASFNFAHDNDSYNQMYFKLLFLKKHQKTFKYLLLSADYSPFSNISDTRNHLYRKYFDPAYLDDYKPGKTAKRIMMTDINNSFDRFMKIRISMTFPKFIESIPAFITHKIPADIPYLKSNGQYIKPGKSTPELFVLREFTSLKVQEDYFQKILDHCMKEDIMVFLIMPPFLNSDLQLYPEGSILLYEEYFKSIADGKKIWYLDYTLSPEFSEEDFTGLAHLNLIAADRFSVILNNRIEEILVSL
jgi:hypothetical protein